MDPSRYLPLFLEEARQHLDAARALAAEIGAGPPGEGLVSGLARHLHSLKGIAACMRYRTMTGLAHTAEEALGTWRRAGGAVPTRARLLDALGACERILAGAERGVLGQEAAGGVAPESPGPERWCLDIRLSRGARALDVLAGVAVLGSVGGESPPRNVLARASRAPRLSVVLSSTLEPGELAAGLARVRGVERFFLEPEAVPFSRVVRPLVGAASLMARILGKRVRFEVDGPGVRLDRRRISALLEALLHVLRNAVDHGIEPPRERLARGKGRCGVVRIRAERRTHEVRVMVEDDGRGFEVERTARVVPRRRFRAAGTAGEISGRGVGLSAARHALAELGGYIVIRARAGKGATVVMALPEERGQSP